MSSKPKKFKRASDFADPYSLEGNVKYPEKLMRKRTKLRTTSTDKKVPEEYINTEGKEKKTCINMGKDTAQQTRSILQHQGVAVSMDFDVQNDMIEPYTVYKRALLETKSYAALSTDLSVYSILDFDAEKNVLKKSSPLLLHRKGENFLCPCNEQRQVFMEKIDSCKDIDTDRLYPPCMHVEFVKDIHNTLICSIGIEADNYSTVTDHTYNNTMKTEAEDLNLMELPFVENVYVVCINSFYGLLCVSFGSIKCLTCKQQRNCHHVKHLNDLLLKYEDIEQPEILEKVNITMFGYKNTHYQLECFSKKKIPFNLPPDLSEKISKVPDDIFIKEDGIYKAFDFDIDRCPYCGETFDDEFFDVRRTTDCILLTRYKMDEVKCYHKVCSNTYCNKVTYYDGQKDCYLNMGRFLIHYEVLRDYMFQFLFSRSTMFSFYTVWSKHQRDNGNIHFDQRFPVSYFRNSWYSFRRLLDIDYKNSFMCEKCGDQPRILLFDGTTLSFQKSFLGYPDSEDTLSNKLHGSSHTERVFINHVQTRKMLSLFARSKKKEEDHDFHQLCSLIDQNKPVMSPLMKHFETIGCLDKCPEEYRDLLKALSSNSPVCGTFHAKNIHLIEQLLKIDSKNIMDSEELLKDLQTHIPLLFNFITELCYLPKFMIPILEEIIDRSRTPFLCKPHDRVDTCDEDHLAFFPNMPKVYERGSFKMDRIKNNQICNKKSSRHPSLLPGIFTVFCEHGICYGFEVMECAESPNRPFTFLRTRFHKAPDVIIYDNSCNLHNYCLNRDPGYFSNTIFVVDGLHWDNHTECSIGYKALSYPFLKTINTQMVEQNNSKLKKLKSSLSYMRPENFMDTLSFFLWHCNTDCKEKILKKARSRE